MMNIGMPELVLIGLLAVVVVGPDRLPGLARSAAKWLARFRQEAGRSLSELRAAADVEDVAGDVKALRAELRATRAELTRSLSEPSAKVREALKEPSPGGPTAQPDLTVPTDGPPMDPEAT
jgi:sec-independent protein translocase protein TatB